MGYINLQFTCLLTYDGTYESQQAYENVPKAILSFKSRCTRL